MTLPGGRIIQSQVPPEYDGWRLDRYLAARFTYYSRNRWTHEIGRGRITRNGKAALRIDERVRGDDSIAYDPGEYREPEVDFGYTILAEEEHFIAVNKTGNLPVHPSGKFFQNTLLYHLESATNTRLYPVHRLDRETSGVILFGKSGSAASRIHRSLQTAVKTYIAVVRGSSERRSFTVSAPLGAEEDALVAKKQGTATRAGREAVTEFTVLFSRDGMSLIRARPKTGRYHQIRAHLEHSGFPIVGDKLYGGDPSRYLEFVTAGYTDSLAEKLGFHRTALHARSLKFTNPFRRRVEFIKAPLPQDMRELVARLLR